MFRRTFVLANASCLFAADDSSIPLLKGKGGAVRLHWDGQWDKPFLFPILTVSGRILSRGWPMEAREGDSTDHGWHRGFWYGHGLINGHDFWREQGREKTSRLSCKSAPLVRGSTVRMDLAMQPPSGKPIGSMRQEHRLADRGALRILDTVIEVHADAGEALQFGDTDDGGFAFRLREEFREDRGAVLRNSDGLTGTKNIWGKPAKWVDFAAQVEGARTGVAMFDHPSNLRYPTRWHARGYGLNAANPFALKSFTKDPAVDGSYTLPAGRVLRLRYRSIIYEGSPDMDALASEFARN